MDPRDFLIQKYQAFKAPLDTKGIYRQFEFWITGAFDAKLNAETRLIAGLLTQLSEGSQGIPVYHCSKLFVDNGKKDLRLRYGNLELTVWSKGFVELSHYRYLGKEYNFDQFEKSPTEIQEPEMKVAALKAFSSNLYASPTLYGTKETEELIPALKEFVTGLEGGV